MVDCIVLTKEFSPSTEIASNQFTGVTVKSSLGTLDVANGLHFHFSSPCPINPFRTCQSVHDDSAINVSLFL